MDSYDTSSSAGNLVVITKKENALKGYAESYNIAVLNDKDQRIYYLIKCCINTFKCLL